MQIQVQTVASNCSTHPKWSVTVDPQQRVSKLKEQVATELKLSHDTLKAVFNGKILRDSQTLDDANIKENSLVAFVVSKRKPSLSFLPTPPIVSVSVPVPAATETKEDKKEPEQKSRLLDIESLVMLGYSVSMATAALEATNQQVERAAELLLSGLNERQLRLLAPITAALPSINAAAPPPPTPPSSPNPDNGGVITVTLNQVDLAAIHRLEELGFPFEQCLDAYVLTGRSESLAAIVLFSNGDAEEDAI